VRVIDQCIWLAVAVVLLPLLAAGCVSIGKTVQSDFYVLSSLADPAGAETVDELPKGITVGVRETNLPQVLDRPQIVTQTSQNEIRFSEVDRWGEPLEDGVTRVLSENLSFLVPTQNIFVLPTRAVLEFDRVVNFEVIRFAYSADGFVLLVARWTLFEGDGETVLAQKAASIREPVTMDDPEHLSYGRIVAGMSQALASLSREIATAIQSTSS
jgi:uncharacterized lipoprotein YmbA